MKKLIALLLALVMVLSLAACGAKEEAAEEETAEEAAAEETTEEAAEGEEEAAEGEEEAAEGEEAASSNVHRDTLTVAISREPKTLIPYGSNDTGTSYITHQIYETLIGYDKDMNLVPCLATEWEQVDETHYRFKLREGVKFHNGNDFTAEDVLYTFEMNTTNDASASTIGPIDVANCVIEDDYTIVIALSNTYPAFLNICTLDIAGIVDKETMEADAEAINGTGPFVFEEWATGDFLKFTSNKEWWGGEINFDNLLLRYIPEASTRAIEAEAGGVDIANINASDAETTDASEEVNLEIYNIFSTSYVSFNCAVEPFNNTKVRQAISLALNKEGIVQANYRGYAEVAESFLSPTTWGYHDAESEYEGYDVEKAKELLAEAGYPDGFTCTYVSNGNQPIAEMVQASLAEIGITVELNVTDFANWLDAITNGKQQMYYGGWTVLSGDATEAFSAFHSKDMGPTNRSFYNNPEVDALIDTIDTETDETKRMEACVELQELLADECVTIGTNVGIAVYSVNKDVEGFYCLSTQSPVFANITFAE